MFAYRNYDDMILRKSSYIEFQQRAIMCVSSVAYVRDKNMILFSEVTHTESSERFVFVVLGCD